MRPDPDSVAINVAVRAGSRDEDETTNGAAHFMEHMFFQGTPRRPSSFDIDRPIASRGGSLNATTGWELITFHAVVRSADVPAALDVLGDVLTNSLFDPLALEKERRVVLQELNARLNNPNTRGSDLFFQSVFAGHPARHLPGGDRATVMTITRDTVMDFRERWFVANNMVIAVVGMCVPDSWDASRVSDSLRLLASAGAPGGRGPSPDGTHAAERQTCGTRATGASSRSGGAATTWAGSHVSRAGCCAVCGASFG